MAIEKINQLTKVTKYQNKNININKEHKNTVQSKNDKTLSNSAKYMIGLTALAGTIAFLTIGSKRGWWKSNQNEIVDYSNELTNAVVTISDIL